MVLTPLQTFRPDWDKVTVARNAEGPRTGQLASI